MLAESMPAPVSAYGIVKLKLEPVGELKSVVVKYKYV
jgi:hypothetical protein